MLPERKLNRLWNYDYSRDNLYYITSCVKDRICCFGSVVDKKMICNDYGIIAEKQWNWLFQRYPYLLCHAVVVMPQIHQAGLKTFQWERSFHDHIIRDDGSFQRISDYINDNPAKWEDDTLFYIPE